MLTMIDKKVAVTLPSTTDSPSLIKKSKQFAEFFVVTPEHSKLIKPVDMATLSMVPEDDSDLSSYLKDLQSTKKPEEHSKTFWFPMFENPGRTED